MSFEGIFKNAVNVGLGSAEYRLNSKERAHISKIRLDSYSNATYVRTGELQRIRYDEIKPRYIAATGLTYDLLISIHDVNSRSTFVYRPYRFALLLNEGKLKKEILSLNKSRPNLEARVMGLQNDQDYGLLLSEAADFITKNRIRLVEVDLFGGSARHIAIDCKLGMSFDILMENRAYRQGELVNNLTVENFEKQLKDGEKKS